MFQVSIPGPDYNFFLEILLMPLMGIIYIYIYIKDVSSYLLYFFLSYISLYKDLYVHTHEQPLNNITK